MIDFLVALAEIKLKQIKAERSGDIWNNRAPIRLIDTLHAIELVNAGLPRQEAVEFLAKISRVEDKTIRKHIRDLLGIPSIVDFDKMMRNGDFEEIEKILKENFSYADVIERWIKITKMLRVGKLL